MRMQLPIEKSDYCRLQLGCEVLTYCPPLCPDALGPGEGPLGTRGPQHLGWAHDQHSQAIHKPFFEGTPLNRITGRFKIQDSRGATTALSSQMVWSHRYATNECR